MREIVKVSEVAMSFLCPRIVYFQIHPPRNIAKTAEMHESRIKHSVEKLLLRELAFNLPDFIRAFGDSSGDTSSNSNTHKTHQEPNINTEIIRNLAESLMENVKYIHRDYLRDVDDTLMSRICEDFAEFLNKWFVLMMNSVDNEVLKEEMRYGFVREQMLFSSSLKMSGCVDKLIEIGDEEKVPCIIRTGRSPESGVWSADRATLAAYAFLIEETYDVTVSRGFVEYIRDASFRATRIRSGDRARALNALKHVRSIKKGKFPEKGRHAPCDTCIFSENCNVKGATLLSKLFKR